MSAPSGRYEMSAAEKAMDCKRLTGSMQISITRLRDPLGRQEPSTVSATAQKLSTPLYGSSAKTADRQAVYARERAKLDAYNDELDAKGCKTIDIEAELARPPEGPEEILAGRSARSGAAQIGWRQAAIVAIMVAP